MSRARSPRVWLLSEYDAFTKLQKSQAKYYDEFAFIFPFKSKSTGREFAWASINSKRKSLSHKGIEFIPENKQIALRMLWEKLTANEVDESEWTVEDAFTNFHKTYFEEMGVSAKSNLAAAMKVFLNPEISEIPLSKPDLIRAEILKIKKTARKKDGTAFAPATLQKYMQTAREIFAAADKLGKADVNPVFTEDMPFVADAVGNPWGYIEFLKFLHWQQQNAPAVVANAFEFITILRSSKSVSFNCTVSKARVPK